MGQRDSTRVTLESMNTWIQVLRSPDRPIHTKLLATLVQTSWRISEEPQARLGAQIQKLAAAQAEVTYMAKRLAEHLEEERQELLWAAKAEEAGQ